MNIDSINLSPRQTIAIGMSHPEPVQMESGQSLFTLIPKNSWKGHRCFIIGGGPTVLTHNLDRLAGELTIGVNRAYDVYYPSILCALDPQFYEWAEDGAFGIFSEMRYRSYPGTKSWAQIRRDSTIDAEGIYTIENINANTNNSGQAAINLAIALGASPIYLIGFDMEGEPNNFHDGYPALSFPNIYDSFVESIEKYVPPKASGKGIKVINLSTDSALTVFPFADYDEVLDSKPMRPILISCYAKGEEQEAAKLVQSAMLYGLECDVVPGQIQKEELIQSMTDKHRRQVLYVDCHNRITEYQAKIEEMEI